MQNKSYSTNHWTKTSENIKPLIIFIKRHLNTKNRITKNYQTRPNKQNQTNKAKQNNATPKDQTKA